MRLSKVVSYLMPMIAFLVLHMSLVKIGTSASVGRAFLVLHTIATFAIGGLVAFLLWEGAALVLRRSSASVPGAYFPRLNTFYHSIGIFLYVSVYQVLEAAVRTVFPVLNATGELGRVFIAPLVTLVVVVVALGVRRLRGTNPSRAVLAVSATEPLSVILLVTNYAIAEWIVNLIIHALPTIGA